MKRINTNIRQKIGIYSFYSRNSMTLLSLIIAGIATGNPLFGNDWAFTGVTAGGHRGAVTAVIHNGNTVISAGEDGCLGIWDTGGSPAGGSPTVGRALERIHVSLYGITAMAQRPGKNEVCLIESDRLGNYRISAWNYRERQNIFTLHFKDPKRYITYSTGGNFIIAAGTGSPSLVFIDSTTGEILRSPESLAGTIALAVTGRSDRNMVVYLASGEISYWDIVSGNMTNTFRAPAGLLSPVLFSNSRYLAGVNRQGLTVVHAVSGEVLATDNTVPGDSFLYSSGNDFFCLIQKNAEAELCRYTINNSGTLVTLDRFPLSTPASGRYTSAALNVAGISGTGMAVLGTSAGNVAAFDRQAAIQTLAVSEKTKITDADVSGTDIAFIAEGGVLGFIPRDYNTLSNGGVLRLEQNREGYNRIVAFTGEDGTGGRFIFWQDRNSRTQPRLRSADPSGGVSVSGGNLRSPVRSVLSFAGKILFLDSAGNVSVISPLNSGGSRPFNFSSVGIIDAAFIDSNRIILARGAVSGNSPFLLLNISTSETVPLPHPSRAGVALHRGTSGKIYAAVISSRSGTEGGENTVITSVVQIDLANSAESVTFTEFQGEAAHFSFAESQGFLAAAVSGESAIMRSPEAVRKPDRTPGLPLRFIDGGPYLVSLDREGNICWHESGNGKLLAVFSLHPDGWILKTERRIIGGGVSN